MASSTTSGNALAPAVGYAFEMFSKARQNIARIFVPGLDLYPDGAGIVQGLSVAPATTSGGTPLQFICDGYLVGILASVRSGVAADAAAALLRIQVNGSTDLFQLSNGGAGFVSFLQLQQGPQFRLVAPIRQATPWNIFVQNTYASSTTIVADITFLYCNRSSPPLTD
jgi:hypothetical protein